MLRTASELIESLSLAPPAAAHVSGRGPSPVCGPRTSRPARLPRGMMGNRGSAQRGQKDPGQHAAADLAGQL
ncbi:unnamed protein product [Pleuronectes platessa]|uniref:Uncharacterized protein n=1 Tax=Pleuronectes platessa TaxID=8262 RepID=A0A9N7UVN1_PLEPL|nr:unnamed protein product [Pleuronectes platessa]